MDSKEEVRRSLKKFVTDVDCTMVFPAQVKAVYEDDKLCDVIDHDEIEYVDVRLRADTNTEGGFLLLPKIDSWVLIGNIGKSETEYFIISYTAIDKVILSSDQMSIELNEDRCQIKKQSTELEIDAEGIKLSSSGESLKGLIGELLTAVKTITVPCTGPGNPSGLPLNAQLFDQLKTRFNSLLK